MKLGGGPKSIALMIADAADQHSESTSHPGRTFRYPDNIVPNTEEAKAYLEEGSKTYLAGLDKFKLTEIEVYQVIFNN